MAKIHPEDTKVQKQYKCSLFLKLLSVCTMPIEGIFFFGLIMGYPNLAEIYKKLGVYESACDGVDAVEARMATSNSSSNGVINCNERDFYFSTAATLGSISMNVCTLPLGVIFDKYGSFWSRSLCATLMSIGLLFLMFTVEVNWFLFPGIIFLNSGSFALLVTNHPLSQLFPKATAFILIAGQMVFQASGSMFRLWAVMFESGIEFKSIITFNLMMTMIIWIRSFFLMPLAWVQSEIPPFYISPFSRRTLNSMPDAKAKELNRKESMAAGTSKSATNYVCSVEFVMFLIWVSIGNLDAIFISFSWNKFARIVSGDDYLPLVDAFGSFLWTAALFSGVCGLVIDTFSGKFNRPLLEGKAVMVTGVFLFDNIAGIVVHILQFLKTYEAAYALVFIYNAYRGLLYSTAAVYIKCNFPASCFGTLMGVFRISMGVSSLINIGLTEIVTTYDVDGFTGIVIAFGVLVVLTISFPILAIYNKRKPAIRSLVRAIAESQTSDETESDN